jgi:hypothetical protein
MSSFWIAPIEGIHCVKLGRLEVKDQYQQPVSMTPLASVKLRSPYVAPITVRRKAAFWLDFSGTRR